MDEFYSSKSDKMALTAAKKKLQQNARRVSLDARIIAMFNQCRGRAREKEVEFDITPEFLTELYNKQKGRCSLTNMPFSIQLGRTPYAPSVDRIDPQKGYVKDNVRFVTVVMNLALNVWGTEVFEVISQAYWTHKLGVPFNPSNCATIYYDPSESLPKKDFKL